MTDAIIPTTSTPTALLPRPRLRFLMIMLAAAALLLTISLTVNYLVTRQQLEQAALDSASSQASAAKQQIDAEFAGVRDTANNIANDLSNGTLPHISADIEARLEAETTANPLINGIGTNFEPFAFSPAERLYQAYRYLDTDGTFVTLVHVPYDYTLPEPPPEDTESRHTAWYHEPIDNGARWDEPFLAEWIGKVLVEYDVPFFFTNDPDKPAGIVSINYSLQTMRELVSSLELGETGYGFVISTDGTYLTHPVRELVVNSNIFDVTDTEDVSFRVGAQRALNGESVMIDGIDPITQDGSWTFFEPLPVTGWALGVVLNKSEFMTDPHQTIREQVAIALSGAAFIVLAAAVALRVDQVTDRSLWVVSGVFSLLCLALIVLVWFLATTLERRVGVQVVDDSAVQSYLEDYTNPAPDETQLSDPPIIIPTGIYVQTVEFPGPTSVSLTGYIWQRYPTDLDENIVRGFTMPQVSSSGYMLDEIQSEEQNGSELVVWNFSANLRQAFNPVWYPFDTRDVAVRLSPRDLSQNIIFTPDFDAYDLMNPRLLPGVDPTVNVNNWRLQSSSYTYELDSYATSFGLTNQGQVGHAPELAFTINTQRMFLGPFIAYLLPGIVIALMLFAFLLYEGKPGEPVQIMTALNYTAALFFVIAITHTGLRSSIGAVGITYMEYLYILLYVVIILIAINTFMLTRYPTLFIVAFRHNLIIKLLFWPLFIGVLLVATLMIFVYS